MATWTLVMSGDLMKTAARQSGNPRGRPFAKGESGNPAGKPKGARHRVTLATEALLDGEAEALTRKAVELALAGDGAALRLCLERILPIRRERPVRFQLPPSQSAADMIAEIIKGVAAGEITPGEAAELVKLVEALVRALEANEFEQRLQKIEEWKDRGGGGRKNQRK
jgi:Family of unknown function (DUF5681)